MTPFPFESRTLILLSPQSCRLVARDPAGDGSPEMMQWWPVEWTSEPPSPSKFLLAGGEGKDGRKPGMNPICEGSRRQALSDFTAFDKSLRRLIPAA
jgi:hypothetical protein